MNDIKDYGYRSPKLEGDNYFSGTLPKIIVNPTGDWRPICPPYEPQFGNGFDSSDCVIFGIENAIQIYLKGVFNVDVNYSERFVSNGMNRDNSVGQDPHLPLEWVRKNGVVKQESLPMVFTMKEYQTPRPLPKYLVDEAKKWGYDLKHEYVFANNPGKELRLAFFREYLKYSPLGISVTAWRQDNTGLFVDDGKPNTHWAVLVHVDEEGMMYVYDSYDLIVNGTSTALIKRLHPDHHIEICKRIYLVSANPEEELSFIDRILKWIFGEVKEIQKKVDVIAPTVPVVEPLPTPAPKYLWDTPEHARHTVRVICDEEKLSVKDKNDLCATIGGESGWNPKAIGKPNYDGSRDYGIIQLNSKYWIGPGKLYPNKDYVLNNPEVCVRWMCKNWENNKHWWYAFVNGRYLNFLNPKFDSKGEII